LFHVKLFSRILIVASGLSVSGTYTFAVSAYNDGGESPGDPITVTILKGKPAKPTGGRIQ